MRIGGCVDDNVSDPLGFCLVNPIYDFTLNVILKNTISAPRLSAESASLLLIESKVSSPYRSGSQILVGSGLGH